jgi:hypothetical protein
MHAAVEYIVGIAWGADANTFITVSWVVAAVGTFAGAFVWLRKHVVRKCIQWFKDQAEEQRNAARAVALVQQHLMTNNGGSTLLDKVEKIDRKVDQLTQDVSELKTVVPQLEEIVTTPKRRRA